LFLSTCFFFQAQDGIRDRNVTGVQTGALPILSTYNPSVPKYKLPTRSVRRVQSGCMLIHLAPKKPVTRTLSKQSTTSSTFARLQLSKISNYCVPYIKRQPPTATLAGHCRTLPGNVQIRWTSCVPL